MSNDATPELLAEWTDGVAVVRVGKNQVSHDTRDALYAFVDELARTGGPHKVILDLSGVKVLNSSAIGVLINFQKRVRDVRGALKICCVDPFVLDLFRLTKMDQVLDLADSRDDAIAAYQGKARPVAPEGGKAGLFSRFFGAK